MFGLFKNRTFNPGGILGATAAVAITLAIALYLLQRNGRLPPAGTKIIIFSALGGGLFGNWLWRLAFGSDNWEPPQQFEISDDRKR